MQTRQKILVSGPLPTPISFLPRRQVDDLAGRSIINAIITTDSLLSQSMQCNGYSDLFEAATQHHHQHNCFRIGRRLFGVIVMRKLAAATGGMWQNIL